MKQNFQQIEEIAKNAIEIANDEKNVIQKTCSALISTKKHLGAKQETLRCLGWEHAEYIHAVDSEEESKTLWEKTLEKSPLAILVITTHGEVIESFIPDFPSFDAWCRTNTIKHTEYWVLPLGTTHEKVLSNQAFDNMSMGASTRHKVNLNLNGLFKKKLQTLEKFATPVFEGITPQETIKNAKGISLMHTSSYDSMKQSGVVRNFSSFKEVETIQALLKEQKCNHMQLFLHLHYEPKPMVTNKENAVES